jgi:hypothetical protein
MQQYLMVWPTTNRTKVARLFGVTPDEAVTAVHLISDARASWRTTRGLDGDVGALGQHVTLPLRFSRAGQLFVLRYGGRLSAETSMLTGVPASGIEPYMPLGRRG